MIALLAGVGTGAGVLGASAAGAQSNDSEAFRSVKVPELKYAPGDVLTPLPADSAYPSGNPRDLEGLWTNIGQSMPADGKRAMVKADVQAVIKRQIDMENKGTPIVQRGTLCRGDGQIGIAGNQFPTQIIQRPDKILFIAEEGRLIWHVYMNAQHPADFKPTHLGHSIGRWEGNTLVVDTVGFRPRGPGLITSGNTSALHVVTKFTRANTGDKRNGDVLVMERTMDDPGTYEQPYTSIMVSRWRPDFEMLEFNCEESTPASQAQGVIVE